MAITASYITGFDYYPEDLMQRDADWVQPGVVTMTDLVATASTTALQVTISGSAENAAGGNAWLPGGYRINNSAALALALAAADPTNPRIDLIEAGVDTTTTPYTPTLRVVTGTPGATPAVPTTDAGFVALYEVEVPANATVPGTVTDVRQLAAPSQSVYTAVPTIVAPAGTKILVYSGSALTPYVSYAGAWVAIATETWTTAQIAANATPLASSAPPAVGTANVQGTSTAAARSDHTHEGVSSFDGRVGAVVPTAGDYTAAEVGAVASGEVGAASGVASLDGTGNVPASQLHNVPPVNAATDSVAGTVETAQTVTTPMSSVLLDTTTPVEVEITGTVAQAFLTGVLSRNGNVRVSGSYRLTAAAQVTLTLTYTDGGGTAQTVPWYTGPAGQAAGTYIIDVIPTFFATTASDVVVQAAVDVANVCFVAGVMEGV